jgi:SAM-dependent methyltransferase
MQIYRESINVSDEMSNYWAEMADKHATDRQIIFLKQTLTTEGLILDFACGTGSHSVLLGKEGYDTVGLDLSLNLKIAKNRWRSIQVVRADMRFLPFKPKAFAAAVSMDNSFGYLLTEREDMRSLLGLRDALSERGMLVLDVFNREMLLQKYKISWRKQFKDALLSALLKFQNRLAKWILLNFSRWKDYPSFLLLQTRTVTPKGKRLFDSWVVYDKASEKIKVFRHVARLYESKELQELLEKAGLTVSHVYGDYERQVFSPNSNRLIMVATV